MQYTNYPFVYLFSITDSPSSYLANYYTKFVPIQKTLPPNVRLETLKTRFDGRVLLRLSHLYALGEDSQLSQPVTIDLRTLFVGLDPVEVVETTLTANLPLKELNRLKWKTSSNEKKSPPIEILDNLADDYTITIQAMDIRTFLIRFQNTGKQTVF